jgi:hypothetical protein
MGRYVGLKIDFSNPFCDEDYENELIIIGNNIKNCIDRNIKIFIIPLTIFYKNNDEINGHANMLIYRVNEDKSQQIEHFEPHGSRIKFSLESEKNNSLESKLSRKMVELKFKMEELCKVSVSYSSPTDICPDIDGVQAIHEDIEQTMDWRGFCALWSILLAELIILAPDHKTSDIYKSFVENALYNPKLLNHIVKGYLMTLDERLNKYGKRYKNLRYLISVKNKGFDSDTQMHYDYLSNLWNKKLANKMVNQSKTKKRKTRRRKNS